MGTWRGLGRGPQKAQFGAAPARANVVARLPRGENDVLRRRRYPVALYAPPALYLRCADRLGWRDAAVLHVLDRGSAIRACVPRIQPWDARRSQRTVSAGVEHVRIARRGGRPDDDGTGYFPPGNGQPSQGREVRRLGIQRIWRQHDRRLWLPM